MISIMLEFSHRNEISILVSYYYYMLFNGNDNQWHCIKTLLVVNHKKVLVTHNCFLFFLMPATFYNNLKFNKKKVSQ